MTVVAQHGLMTPLAPPLPADAHLLAWSAADGEFWISGRQDIRIHEVGSQLLHYAAQQEVELNPAAAPLFLGQLHGAELPRWRMAKAAYSACRNGQAIYRPHPAERDVMSRLQHRWWAQRGIRVDHHGGSLLEARAPVVSVFSTGVLEAAASGLPAWVTYPDPPRWLEEFWERYGMSRLGQAPTARPRIALVEPALVAAGVVADLAGSAVRPSNAP